MVAHPVLHLAQQNAALVRQRLLLLESPVESPLAPNTADCLGDYLGKAAEKLDVVILEHPWPGTVDTQGTERAVTALDRNAQGGNNAMPGEERRER